MNKDIVIVNYSDKSMSLDYSCLEEDGLWMKLNLKEVTASGEGKDYTKAEQEAQLYLIKNALSKSTHFHKLERVIGITQNILFSEEEKVIKITLKGYGVFE